MKTNILKDTIKSANINKLLFVCLICLITALPLFSSAQSVTLQSDKQNHNVGDTFLVKVNFNSLGKHINSLGGTLLIPKNLFDVKEILTGDSFISLWIERPALNLKADPNSKNNEIVFAGGLPGGYSGSDGLVFSLVLKAKNEGSGNVNIKDLAVFLNDGRGTLASAVQLTPLLSYAKKDSTVPNEIYKIAGDSTPPESFTLAIDRDSMVENNKYFVSFFATDKGLGVSNYIVEEYPWITSLFGAKKIWDNSQNPQVLYYQKWGSVVKVKAVDLAGNIREEKITKSIDSTYIMYLLIALLVLIIVYIIRKRDVAKRILLIFASLIVNIIKSCVNWCINIFKKNKRVI